MLQKTPGFRLDGKSALVTGAGRGIGMAAAIALAQAGAKVTLVSRTEQEIAAVSEQINQEGGSSDYATLDVTDSAWVSAVVHDRGPFNILVNSAGMNRPMNLVDVKDSDLDDIMNLNVKAAFYTSRAVAQGLLAAKQTGSFINISSQMGHVGSPGRTVYCATKHAIEGMTKALAWELGVNGIRVNSVCPTFIETAFTAGMFKEEGFRDWVVSKIALGRIGRLEEVMGPITFLASDASSLITGSALMLDGGWTAA
jgi:NAD(P)-dependent dehydrogenase (short-subunit alcohol dehydrogenase family)